MTPNDPSRQSPFGAQQCASLLAPPVTADSLPGDSTNAEDETPTR